MKIKSDCIVSLEGFLLNPRSGESFSLNASAMDLFSLLKTEQTEESLLLYLQEMYDVDLPTLQADLSDFLFLLRYKELLDE